MCAAARGRRDSQRDSDTRDLDSWLLDRLLVEAPRDDEDDERRAYAIRQLVLRAVARGDTDTLTADALRQAMQVPGPLSPELIAAFDRAYRHPRRRGPRRGRHVMRDLLALARYEQARRTEGKTHEGALHTAAAFCRSSTRTVERALTAGRRRPR